MSVISFSDLLPGHEQKTVVEAQAEGKGFLLELSCGHILFSAIPYEPGRLAYCRLCIDEMRKAMDGSPVFPERGIQ